MISEQAKDYLLVELTQMSKNIEEKYEDRISNNPFAPFQNSNSQIIKYMSLGRSFDSQLGGRIQRVCMFMARERFGKDNVPNFIFITVDKSDVEMYMFSYPDDFVKDFEIDEYKTQKVFKIENEDQIVERIYRQINNAAKNIFKSEHKITTISKKFKDDFAKYETELRTRIRSSLVKYTFTDCSKTDIAAIKNTFEPKPKNGGKPQKKNKTKKEILIDLLYIDAGNIFAYEIKISGGLDTKNRESNADEVIRIQDLFSFWGAGKVNSYFAGCYNSAGGDDGVSAIKSEDGVLFRGTKKPGGPMYDIVSVRPEMSERIIVGSVFREKILPITVSYSDFIKAYQEAFKASKIEDIIVRL